MPVFGVQILSVSASDLKRQKLAHLLGMSVWVQELPSTPFLGHAMIGCLWSLWD